jgi:hypothetical protein
MPKLAHGKQLAPLFAGCDVHWTERVDVIGRLCLKFRSGVVKASLGRESLETGGAYLSYLSYLWFLCVNYTVLAMTKV